MNTGRKSFLGVAAVLFFLCCPAAKASAQDFSADMVSRVGSKITQSKLNVSGDKIRMDMTEGIMIIRIDKQVSWMLMPSENMYMENPLDMSRVPHTSGSFTSEIERTPLGTEEIDGQQAQKFKVTYQESGTTKEVYQWLVNSVPVKVEAVDASWSTEYKNISFSAQPAGLFEIPAGYTMMQMPSLGDMGMDMGGVVGGLFK